jgi:hypothetical protein
MPGESENNPSIYLSELDADGGSDRKSIEGEGERESEHILKLHSR